MQILSAAEFKRLLASPTRREGLSAVHGTAFAVVGDPLTDLSIEQLPACPVMSLASGCRTADLVIAENEIEVFEARLNAQPHAAATLASLLRYNASLPAAGGLLLESLAYSALQHGAGFAAWLSKRPPAAAPAPSSDNTVEVQRDDSALTLTLNRPHVHNAFNSNMRDALCEGFSLAYEDGSIKKLVLQGNGPSFCAGGDLSEFGQASDAAVAHTARVTRSAADLLAALPCASTANLHGACIGAGIELPAFTKQVNARIDAFFQLPEVAMGLVPGAGGTVSISRRIGRQRTNYMAISNQRVDAETALAWGLVDRLAG